MARTDDHRLAVIATLGESCRLTWDLRVPHVVLAALIALPWAIGSALGVFDPMKEFSALSASGQTVPLTDIPFGNMATLWLGGIVLVAVYGIFWYRYLLLGSSCALKFGFAQLNAMFWRSLGCGAVVILSGLLAVVLTAVAASLLGGLVIAALGLKETIAGAAIVIVLIFLAYMPPAALMLRMALVFPAIALGEKLTFGESWSAARGSTWRLFGTLLLALLPTGILAYAITFSAFSALGINIIDPAESVAVYDYWWVSFLLSPIGYLPVALAFAVVAVAFRDLTGTGRALEPASQERFAH